MKLMVFDVGGTEIKYSVMSETATVLNKGNITTPQTGLKDFLAALQRLYEENGGNAAMTGIGISMPGIIDSDRGFCHTGGALLYNQNQPMAALLTARCHCPVHIENDGKCAVLAEYATGSLQGCQNAAVYLLGTGVGGGLIIGGEPVRGQHFSAGEFSYLCTDADAWGREDSMVGINSCTGALVAAVRAAAGLSEEKSKKYANPFNGKDAFALINAGSPAAVAALRQFCHHIAIQIYNLQILLDVERVAIGGGISRQPVLIETLRQCFAELMETAPPSVKKAIRQTVEIVPCRYGNEANQIGALQSYLKSALS